MSLHHIRVKLVNIHQSNDQIHALLHKDNEVQILLLQKPWFGTVVTTRSDTDPNGTPQWGLPINPTWKLFLPKHTPDNTCKAITYVRKSLTDSLIVINRLDHPLSMPNLIVLDILERDQVTQLDKTTLQLINIYHPCR